jgi:hypothetical protein
VWWPTIAGATLTAGVGIAMRASEKAMKAHGGHGIVALELARGPQRARAIVDDWGAEGVAAARRSIRLDWAFVPSYVLLGASLGLALDAPVAAGAVVVAGGCDVVENLAMLRVLDGRYDAQWAAFGAATTKWALLAAALVLALFRT